MTTSAAAAPAATTGSTSTTEQTGAPVAAAASAPSPGAQGQQGQAAAAAPAAATNQDSTASNTKEAAEGGSKSLLEEAGADAGKADASADKTGEGTKEKTETPKTQGAPESYADFKLPEGVEQNEAMLTEFRGLAKELNLSQEQAQKLVDLQAKMTKGHADATQAQWKETVDNWKKETLQSLGANYKEELAFAAKSRDRFASPELRQLLDETGLSNHKAVLSMFIQLGKTISEDSFVDRNGAGVTREKTAAEIWYPTMARN